VYRCPGRKLSYHYTNEEDGGTLRRYWTTAARSNLGVQRDQSGGSRDGSTNMCAKPCNNVSIRTHRRCAYAARRLSIPSARPRCGWARRLMKSLPKVATEMSLPVLAYNLTRVMNIIGIKPPGSAPGIAADTASGRFTTTPQPQDQYPARSTQIVKLSVLGRYRDGSRRAPLQNDSTQPRPKADSVCFGLRVGGWSFQRLKDLRLSVKLMPARSGVGPDNAGAGF
jgi:hypothetical protein